MKDLFQVSCPEERLERLIQKVIKELSQHAEPYCLWLRGDLGAGKTTFVRHYLHTIGLPQRYPVNSPTFTYIQEYEIKGKWFAHLDLYRLLDSGDCSEESIVGDYRQFSGYFVEWPEALKEPILLKPTHSLEILSQVSDKGQPERRYIFSTF